jgi:hypothetical protein
VGPPDSLVVHQTGPVHCLVRHLAPVLTLRAQSRTVHYSLLLLQMTVGAVAITPLGTPDSPVRQTRAAFDFLCSFDLNPLFYICIGLL